MIASEKKDRWLIHLPLFDRVGIYEGDQFVIEEEGRQGGLYSQGNVWIPRRFFERFPREIPSTVRVRI